MSNTIYKKTIVITGASSGAGRCMALELACEGANLVLASRNKTVLEELAEECFLLGAEVLVVYVDVTDHESVQHLALKAFEWKGRLDVWINNAGVLAAGTFEETPWQVHQQVVNTNLLGYMSGAYAALPYFKKQGYGHLINNISIGGFLPVPFAGAYTAGKFALRGFFESLKGELTDWPDIYITDLFPAFLDTPGIQHAANYTGKVLKPAPPVYDPLVLARSVKQSIQQPCSTRYPGAASLLFKTVHSVMPELMVSLTARFMKAYFRKAPATAATSGNVLNTVNYAMSTNGNAGPRLKPYTTKKMGAALLLAAIGLTAFAIAGKK